MKKLSDIGDILTERMLPQISNAIRRTMLQIFPSARDCLGRRGRCFYLITLAGKTRISTHWQTIVRRRIALMLFFAAATSLPLTTLWMGVVEPVIGLEKMKWPDESPSSTIKAAKSSTIDEGRAPCVDPDLRCPEALFLKSQLDLATGDSTGLVIDLAASTVTLSLFGVSLRECPIRSYSLSHSLMAFTGLPAVGRWLSRPFILEKSQATIVKDPIRVKKAPRESSSAKEMASLPVTPLDDRDVFVQLSFNRDLVVILEQEEPIGIKALPAMMEIRLKRSVRTLLRNVLHLIALRRIHPQFSIKLTCTQADVKAVYRALPSCAGLALRLPEHTSRAGE